jgi:hypothetical protein
VRFAAIPPLVLLVGLATAGCSRGTASPRESTATASGAVSSPPAPEPTASDAGRLKPFGAPCVGDPECAGTVCFHKRIKGPDAGKERRGGDDAVEHDGYCSIRCSHDAECPVPPTKGRCGARGMCKRPD